MAKHTVKMNVAHPKQQKCLHDIEGYSGYKGNGPQCSAAPWLLVGSMVLLAQNTPFHYARQDLFGIEINSIKQSGPQGPPTDKIVRRACRQSYT